MANKEISIGVKLITDLKDFTSGFKQAQDTSAKFGDNIEKNVAVPLNKLTAQLRGLKSAQGRSFSPEEYAKIGDEIKRVQGEIDRFKGKGAQAGGMIGNMVGMAKQLLPAFSFAAIGAGAVYAFNQIKNSTDTLATQWEVFIGGLNSGINEFWRSIATGDWSNLIDNMKEAVRVGREYAAMIDDIEEKTRALSIMEADSAAKATELEIRLKNKQLSNADRIKAGEERIQIERDIQANRIKVAQESFDAELMIAAQQTKLSKDRLIQIVADMDSETKVKAKAYNDQLALIETLRAANKTVMTTAQGSILMQNADTEQIKQLQQQVNAAADSVKMYAEELRKTGNTTDEQLDKMVGKYVDLKNAQNSAAENTKKVQTTVNSLIADTNKELEKEWTLRQKLGQIAAEKAAPKMQKIATPETAKSVTSGRELNSSELGMLGYMGYMLDANTEKYQKFKQELADSKIDNIMSLADSFDQLGYSIGGAFGQFVSGIGEAISMIPTLLAQIAALTTAQVSSSQSITMAKGSEAIASGTAASQAVPFPFNIIALAATIASIVSALATPIKGFATGGVIPGTSFSGDKVLIRANSGEEVLTASDPRHRNNRGYSTTGSGTTQVEIINEARIKAESLYILQKKAERRIARRT